MSSNSILRQLIEDKKPLIAVVSLLLGIGIIRHGLFTPKPAETIGFSSNPQAIHREVSPFQFSALLRSNAPIGVVLGGGQKPGPEEESRAYLVSGGFPGLPPGANSVAAAKPRFDGLSWGAEKELFAKL